MAVKSYGNPKYAIKPGDGYDEDAWVTINGAPKGLELIVTTLVNAGTERVFVFASYVRLVSVRTDWLEPVPLKSTL
jgi:hypothetical protein